MDDGSYQALAGAPYFPPAPQPQPVWVSAPPAAPPSQPLIRPQPKRPSRKDDEAPATWTSVLVHLLFISGFCFLFPWCCVFTLCHGSSVRAYQRLSDASANLFLFFSAIVSLVISGFIWLTIFCVVMYLIFFVYFPIY